MTGTIIDFLTSEKIPFLVADHHGLKTNFGKKGFRGLKGSSGWEKWDYKECIKFSKKTIEKYDCDVVVPNLRNTQYIIHDIDGMKDGSKTADEMKEDLNNNDFFKTLITPSMSGKFHYWFEIEGEQPSKDVTKLGFDIITEQIYEYRNTQFKKEDIKKITKEEYLTELKKVYNYTPKPTAKTKKPKNLNIKKEELNSVEIEENNTINYKMMCNKEIAEIGDMIDIKFLDDYNDWTRIIWSLRSYKDDDEMKEIARNISKRSDNYTDNGFDEYWGLYNYSKKMGIGSFLWYGRLSNEKKYVDIRSNYFVNKVDWESGTDGSLAKVFVRLYGEIYLYQTADNEDKATPFYIYNGIYWETTEGTELRNAIEDKLGLFYHKKALEYLKQKAEIDSSDKDWQEKSKYLDDKWRALEKISRGLEADSKTKKIFSKLKDRLKDNNVEWEKNPYLFAFTNKIYDLEKDEWHIPEKSDYVKMTTGKPFIDPPSSVVDELNKLIESIFPDPKIRLFYMIVHATCLCGIHEEQFIVANGEGNNGKGFLNELLMLLLGNGAEGVNKGYGVCCSPTILYKEMKEGGNPMIANMNMMRCVIFKEPKAGEKIEGSTMKELTGGGYMSARKLYSNKTNFEMGATFILECNKRLGIKGEITNGEKRRLKDVPFEVKFSSQPKSEPNYYGSDGIEPSGRIALAIQGLKDKENLERLRCAYFMILKDYFKKYLKTYKRVWDDFTPSRVVDRTQKYFEDNDLILSWFNKHYEIVWKEGIAEKEREDKKGNWINVDDTELVFCGELYNKFVGKGEFNTKDSLYNNLTKKQKLQDYNRTNFIDKLKTHFKIGQLFKGRERRKEMEDKYLIKGRKTLRNVLVGVMRKKNEDNYNFEEENEI